MTKLSDAFGIAQALHAGQFRKGTSIPYFTHLTSVSALVLEHGGDEEQAIAGLLHDVLEDCGLEHAEEIRRRFGSKVLCIVEGCTDGVQDSSSKKPDWKSRKETYLAHLVLADDETLLVSACDKLHNARSILMDLRSIGLEVLTRLKAGKDGTLWYYASLAKVFADRLPGPLSDEIGRTVAALVTEAGPGS